MSNSWDQVWGRLSPVFEELVFAVGKVNAKATSQMGRTKAAHFPFGAYLTFDQSGESGEEWLVVSVDCKSEDRELFLACDISRGDGEILEDGPTARLDDDASVDRLLAWVDEVVRFLRNHEVLVCAELAPKSPSS